MNQLATGKSDELVLNWIRKSAPRPKTAAEIELWSQLEPLRAPADGGARGGGGGPADVESRKFFNSLQEQVAPTRDDIMTWFDLLDVDDYVSFGAKA